MSSPFTIFKPKTFILLTQLSFALFILQSCKKDFIEEQALNLDGKIQLSSVSDIQASGSGDGYCWEDAEDGNEYDSILKPTILGAQLINNPYSVTNMSQALLNLTNNAAGVTVNAWYIRVKPSNYEQLVAVEDLDVDWFDYPLDYELIQEGDYYDDGITPAEEIPWLYAVVAPNFIPPSGVVYELLESIHVPDNYYLEDEAFRITGNIVDTADCSINSIINEEIDASRPTVCDCETREAISCACREICGLPTWMCNTPLQPPPPTTIPAGAITVTDDVRNNQVPVRNARVIARRFLKVERVFTNNNGNYSFTKTFRNKATLLIKFKNNDAIVKGLRGVRLWQILMPVKINLGKFRGNLSNIPHNIANNNNVRSRGAKHWAAATTHNAVQEFKQDYTDEGMGMPPNKLRILVIPGNGAGSAPMFAKRFINTLPHYFIREYILIPTLPYPLQFLNTLGTVLAGSVDVTIGYNGGDGITAGNDAMTEVCYHEFTHAAHYAKVGNTQYGNFIQSSINEIIANFGTEFSPYGQGNTGNSPIIALYESWAYHMGHWLTNRKYGAFNIATFEQNFIYRNGFIQDINFNIVAFVPLNAHVNLLEDFNPRRTVEDPFWWIPQGLFYDLMDDRNDNMAAAPPRVPLEDNVSNYTNQQFFNALDADIINLPAYRIRLLNENANNQAAGVNTIFTFYGN